jgi:hypothetical protein
MITWQVRMRHGGWNWNTGSRRMQPDMMKPHKLFIRYAVLILILTIISVSHVYAQNRLSARVEIGINLLPSVIAANKRLSFDDDDKEKPINIYLVYSENKKLADLAKKKLDRIKKIRGHKVEINSIMVQQLLQLNVDKYAAVMVVEPMGENRDKLVLFSRDKQIILFSPFKGDVKKGVMAGFEVTNKVLPAVNDNALQAANIHLKAFFLRIAVNHD